MATTGLALGCTPRAEKLYNNGLDLLSKGKYLEAVDVLEDSAVLDSNKQRQAKSISEAARILRLEIKDYAKALMLYRKLILEAEDALVRLQAQEREMFLFRFVWTTRYSSA